MKKRAVRASAPLCAPKRDGEVTKRQRERKDGVTTEEIENDGKMLRRNFCQKVTDGVGSEQMDFDLSTSAPLFI